MSVTPYLFFDGDCEAALEMYQSLCGARIESLMRFGGSPAEASVPPEWRNMVLHAAFELSGSPMLACDAPPGRYHRPAGVAMTLEAASPTEAKRIFDGLAEGGKVSMPLGPTFFAESFGMLVDRFGIPWMVTCQNQA